LTVVFGMVAVYASEICRTHDAVFGNVRLIRIVGEIVRSNGY